MTTVAETDNKIVDGEQEPVYSPTARLNIYSLAVEIEQELEDARYEHLTHGKPATYKKGCRGPLCRYAHRERLRNYRTRLDGGEARKARPRKEQTFDKVIARILDSVDSVADCPMRAKVYILASIRREVLKPNPIVTPDATE